MLKNRIPVLLVGIIISAISLVGCNNTSKQSVESTTQTLQVEAISGDIKEEITLSGSIKSTRSSSVLGENSTIEEIYVSSNEEVLIGEDIILLENGNVIEAPFSGKITKINVSKGDEVAESTTVFNIIDNTSYAIDAYVSEDEISKISVGQKVDITIGAIDKTYEGKVSAIEGEPSVNGNNVVFGITIILDGDFKNLYAGMSSEMSIIIKESTDALLIPIESIKTTKDNYSVVLKDGNSTKEVTVELGLQNNNYVEILSGIKPGDIVIYSRQQKSNNSSSTKGNNQTNNGEGMPGGGMPDFSQMPNGNIPDMNQNTSKKMNRGE